MGKEEVFLYMFFLFYQIDVLWEVNVIVLNFKVLKIIRQDFEIYVSIRIVLDIK